MFKLLILIGIIYLGYRLFFGPPLLKGQDPRRVDKHSDDDDYVDYEEVK